LDDGDDGDDDDDATDNAVVDGDESMLMTREVDDNGDDEDAEDEDDPRPSRTLGFEK